MEFIIANEKGEEVTLLTDKQYIDIEIGEGNTFSIQISKKYQKKWGIDSGWWIGCPGKEYGGIIDGVKSVNETIVLSGKTWRGLLEKKIIEPPSGQDYRFVSGDANTIINNTVCSEFDGIFVCDTNSGINIDSYNFDRYVNSLVGIEKMLLKRNSRLSISYESGEPNSSAFVRLKAVPIHDYSDELEYSKDGSLSYLYFSFENFTGGINHLICLGKGELKDRLVVHLYVQEDGSIGPNQYYFGKDERESTFEYSNTDSVEELIKNGTERLKELMSYKSMDIDLYNESLAGLKGIYDDISIGDIVGGRDFDTGIYLSKQITRKIVQVKNGRESIEYKVGDETKTSSPSGESSTESNGITLLDVYPIGSIYMSANNVNPGTIFGGTWEEWGAGRVPVGVDVNDSNFNGVEKTGGASTHTLSAEQIPMHSHGLNEHTHSIPNLSGKTNNTGNHTHRHGNSNDHGFASFNDSTGETRVGYSTDYVYPAGYNKQTQSTGAHEHTVTTNASTTGKASGNTESVGSGKSHNNLQPYITCYMWKRIA